MSNQTRSGVPLILSVFRLNVVARRAFAERMATEQWAIDAGMRPGCFGVLRVVAASDEPLSQRELSDRIGIDPSDVVGLVDLLEDAGYVARRRDEADRRRYALALTDAGWEAVARFDAVAAEVTDEVLGPLDAAERAELERLIRLVLAP